MSTLRVLMPPVACVEHDPGFRRWLAQGDRRPSIVNARGTTLRSLFHLHDAELPAAALRHYCYDEDAAHGTWLCADPAWVQTEATGARLMAWPIEDLCNDEADALATALRPLFGDAGVPLVADTPSTWCVQLADGAPAANFTAPVDALGAAMLDCLPEGAAGRTWRRLFNEAQVALHAHPVNAARVAAGKHPVNALWFWGRGALPAVQTGLHVVASVDDVVRGLAKLGDAVRVEPLPETLDLAGGGGDALLDLDVPGQAQGTLPWLAHFQRWLRDRRFEAIELMFAGGECFRVRHVHRLRMWRRA
ncbi:MAG TPA: phosphoglycerate mutase [Rhodanobacteraceae bacterium]